MCLASPHNMPARNCLTPPASTLAHRLTVMHPKMGIGMRWPQGWKLPPKVLGSHSPSMIARLIVNIGPLEGTPRHAPHTRPTVCSQGQTQVIGDSLTTGLGPGPRVGQTWISIWNSRNHILTFSTPPAWKKHVFFGPILCKSLEWLSERGSLENGATLIWHSNTTNKQPSGQPAGWSAPNHIGPPIWRAKQLPPDGCCYWTSFRVPCCTLHIYIYIHIIYIYIYNLNM